MRTITWFSKLRYSSELVWLLLYMLYLSIEWLCIFLLFREEVIDIKFLNQTVFSQFLQQLVTLTNSNLLSLFCSWCLSFLSPPQPRWGGSNSESSPTPTQRLTWDCRALQKHLWHKGYQTWWTKVSSYF